MLSPHVKDIGISNVCSFNLVYIDNLIGLNRTTWYVIASPIIIIIIIFEINDSTQNVYSWCFASMKAILYVVRRHSSYVSYIEAAHIHFLCR